MDTDEERDLPLLLSRLLAELSQTVITSSVSFVKPESIRMAVHQVSLLPFSNFFLMTNSTIVS